MADAARTWNSGPPDDRDARMAAAELGAHRGECPACRWGDPAYCPIGRALTDAIPAAPPGGNPHA